MKKIFIVEDDANIRDLVSYALEKNEYQTEGFSDAAALYEALRNELPDLILLDIMLEGEDGYSILKRLRQSSSSAEVPVIMMTAKNAEMDKVRGLDLGADDYVTKPFGVMELMSRVRAVLRRTGEGIHQKIYEFHEIRLDHETRMVTVGGRPIGLTYKEFELLAYMMKNVGVVLTRDQMMNTVWDYDYSGETRTVDVHIRTLRAKLGEAAHWIHTVRNVGYRLGE
ncbi:MAG: response regulator transcription factor [Peptoniphilaceae bacterium]|nr:response regulator transcription factor [Peptoniphilaceae bacterium]MCI6659717.1 response regulator transcription factor [Peptoniphilaceae bacterium]MDD7434107.1 response regulator transcription factor [Peptoniphilaceae bacterium]MDY3075429.1 response regulator transcription factor [Peptoniphilaceae bacterium]MDY3986439.1 response regulator transcription factor [Peptoniphilaceae bacterium]